MIWKPRFWRMGAIKKVRENQSVNQRVRLGIPRRADTAELVLESVYWVMFVFFLLPPRPGSGGEETNTHTHTLSPNTSSTRGIMLCTQQGPSGNLLFSLGLALSTTLLKQFRAKVIKKGRTNHGGPKKSVTVSDTWMGQV